MSTDLALQSMMAQLPAFASSDIDSGLASLASSAPPRLSTKGGRISAIVDGAVVAGPFIEMDIIIVGVFPEGRATSRVYYAGKYTEGSNDSPTCASARGDVPDAGVEVPQAATCATCPQNVKGSADNGGTACGYTKRLAVMLPTIPEMVFELRVSARGLFEKDAALVDGRSWTGLNSYAATLYALARANPAIKMDMTKVITTISCPLGQTEGLRFSTKGWASAADYNAAVAAITSGLRDDVLHNRVDNIAVAALPPAAPAPSQQAAPDLVAQQAAAQQQAMAAQQAAAQQAAAQQAAAQQAAAQQALMEQQALAAQQAAAQQAAAQQAAAQQAAAQQAAAQQAAAGVEILDAVTTTTTTTTTAPAAPAAQVAQPAVNGLDRLATLRNQMRQT